MAQIAISGHLYNTAGSPVVGANVTFQLVNYGSALPYVSGVNTVVPTSVTLVTNSSGVFSGSVQGNDTITPANTVYQVIFPSEIVAAYSFTGSGPINLDSYPPLNQVPPASGPVPSNILTGNNTFAGPQTLTGENASGNIALKAFAADGVQFVSNSGNDANDGTSLGTAKLTIQAAINAAGTPGVVIVSPSVSASESYLNSGNIPVIDQRLYNAGALGLYHGVSSSRPVAGFPLGSDMQITANGPADIPLTCVKLATTTTASLSVGVNSNVLVGSTANFAPSTSAGIIVGRGTANEENATTFTIVDATHFSITCAKTHSGTTDIEQIGTVALDARAVVINAAQAPAQNPNYPLPFLDVNLLPVLYLPRNTEQGGLLNQNIFIPSGLKLIFTAGDNNPAAGSYSQLYTPFGAGTELANFNGSAQAGFLGPFISYAANPAAGGMLRLNNIDTIGWRNAGNTADIALSAPAASGPATITGANGISAGSITLASGTGSHTFATAYASAPIVTLGPSVTGNTYKVSSTTTAVTITSSSGTDTSTVNWIAAPDAN